MRIELNLCKEVRIVKRNPRLGAQAPPDAEPEAAPWERTGRGVAGAAVRQYLGYEAMETWRLESELGFIELSRHRPRQALAHFGRAMSACPERRCAELARILFYLGITLQKMGFSDQALRSWLVSQKLQKRGFTRKMLERYANGYGMTRQSSREEDDWQAFYAIHAGRYLSKRAAQSFGSEQERRWMADLIRSHWDELRSTRDLEGMSDGEKSRLFRRMAIPFPSFVSVADRGVIPVDFARRRRVAMEDRCPCGSGLRYCACCGRIPGPEQPGGSARGTATPNG